jgi:hypothetical protein
MNNTSNTTPRLTALKNNTSLFNTINNPTEQEIEFILDNDSHLLNIRNNKELYLNKNFSQTLKIKFVTLLPEIILEIDNLNEDLVLKAAKANIHILRNKILIPFISKDAKLDLLRRIPITVCFFEDIPLDIQEMYFKRGTSYVQGIKNVHPSLFNQMVRRNFFPANLITTLNNTTNVNDIMEYVNINKKIIRKLNLRKEMIIELLNIDLDIVLYIEDIDNDIIKEFVLPRITEQEMGYSLLTLCKNHTDLILILLNKFPGKLINSYLSFVPVELLKEVLLIRPDLFSSINRRLETTLTNEEKLNMISVYKVNDLKIREKSLILLLKRTSNIPNDLKNWLICSILSLNANFIRRIKNPNILMQKIAMNKNPNVATKIHNISSEILTKFNIDLNKANRTRFETACLQNINLLNNRQNFSEDEIKVIETLSFEVLSKLNISYLTPRIVVNRISVLINSNEVNC